uniref:SitA5 family polymorphic toxin n=1 Tax=Corallococcus exiguus TaxID=83462 RepID=UPI0030B80C9E
MVTPPSGGTPVEVNEADFEEAVAVLARAVRPTSQPQAEARRLWQVEPRSGSYLYDPRSRHITPLGPGEHLEGDASSVDVELTRAYLRWCERTARPGDCLRLLLEGPTVNGDGRYALAMALAQGVVLEELLDAFKDMADPQAMLTTVLWTWTTYMVLLAVPEPFSKGLAAVMTATLIAYVGVDTFWNLIVGFKQLVEAADRATTFSALREAGERYGKVMGRNAARAFALLATAAIGSTAPGLAAKVPRLPGAALATVQAESQLGLRFAAVGQVETVAVSAGTVTVALAPGAVAMAANGGGPTPPAGAPRGWGSFSGFKKAQGPAGPGKEWHHIVEQTPGNVQRFGPQALHNTENVIPLDKGLHARVSQLYSSIRRNLTGSGGLTVRQWLSTRPYEAQRDFGLRAIDNVSKGLW